MGSERGVLSMRLKESAIYVQREKHIRERRGKSYASAAKQIDIADMKRRIIFIGDLVFV